MFDTSTDRNSCF